MRLGSLLCALLGGIAFGFNSSPVQAQTPPADSSEKLGEISVEQLRTLFRGRPTDKEAKKYCRLLGEYLITQAHPTGTNPTVNSSSSVFDPQTKTVTWSMSVSYGGGLSNKKYNGSISIVVDFSDPKSADLEKIEFRDSDNWIKPNNGNLGEARKTINKMLDK